MKNTKNSDSFLSLKQIFYNLFNKDIKQPSDKSTGFYIVFNTAGLGDVLLCNGLCRNIKLLYPASKVIFVADKVCKDAALYQDSVDDVLVYDKNGKHKGITGLIKFLKDYQLPKPDCTFLTYKNERNYLISKLLGASRIICSDKKKNYNIQLQHINLLTKLTGREIKNLPIKYNVPSDILPAELKELLPNDYIVLCPVSKNPTKDLTIEFAGNLIDKLRTNHNIVIAGHGNTCAEFGKQLKNSGYNFINLINKTTIPELAAVLKNAKCMISVDTGPAHLSYACGTPTIILFRESGTSKIWAPDKNIYPHTYVFEKNVTTEQIYNTFLQIKKNFKDAATK